MKNLPRWIAAIIACVSGFAAHAAHAQATTGTGMNPGGQFTITSRVFNNAPGRTLVTTAAAANGFQISPSRDVDVRYSVTITGTATIGGAVTGTVVLEICPTNSATASDWVTISQFAQGQTFGVVVGISCTQMITSSVRGTVPAGYYARVRTINTAGTPTFAMNSGQEILL